MFPSAPPRETSRFSENKINCSPRGQSLSVYYPMIRFLIKLHISFYYVYRPIWLMLSQLAFIDENQFPISFDIEGHSSENDGKNNGLTNRKLPNDYVHGYPLLTH